MRKSINIERLYNLPIFQPICVADKLAVNIYKNFNFIQYRYQTTIIVHPWYEHYTCTNDPETWLTKELQVFVGFKVTMGDIG